MENERVLAVKTIINETQRQCHRPSMGAKSSDKRIAKALKILGFSKKEIEEVLNEC